MTPANLSPDDLHTITDGCYSERQELASRIRSDAGKQSTTPAQQPEHCEHKEVCHTVWRRPKRDCPYNNEGRYQYHKCKHDTRSRPHHPAPEQFVQPPIPCSPENSQYYESGFRDGYQAGKAEAARTATLAAYEAISDAIENQKDHKEFLLSRDTKDIVLDIIDGIKADYIRQGCP